MKKIITILSVLMLFTTAIPMNTYATTTNATSTVNWDATASLKRINTIGAQLLKANNLPQNITFKVSDDEDINAYANINQEIYVQKGMLLFVNDDQELAAVMAHEIGHIVNAHCSRQAIMTSVVSGVANSITTEKNATSVAIMNSLAASKMSRNDEYEADLTGVDLLVKAGYSPKAMISVLNKICGNYIDVFETHPSGEKRLLNIYDYTAYNYPNELQKNFSSDSYNKAMTMINVTLNDRKANPKKLKKAEKTQAKLKAKKLKRARKMLSSTNSWNTSLALIQLLTDDSNPNEAQ